MSDPNWEQNEGAIQSLWTHCKCKWRENNMKELYNHSEHIVNANDKTEEGCQCKVCPCSSHVYESVITLHRWCSETCRHIHCKTWCLKHLEQPRNCYAWRSFGSTPYKGLGVVINLHKKTSMRNKPNSLECQFSGAGTVNNMRETREKAVWEDVETHQSVYIVVYSLHRCTAWEPPLSVLSIRQTYTNLFQEERIFWICIIDHKSLIFS